MQENLFLYDDDSNKEAWAYLIISPSKVNYYIWFQKTTKSNSLTVITERVRWMLTDLFRLMITFIKVSWTAVMGRQEATSSC